MVFSLQLQKQSEIPPLQLPRYAAMPPIIPVYYIPIQSLQTNGVTNDGIPKNTNSIKQQQLPFSAPYSNINIYIIA